MSGSTGTERRGIKLVLEGIVVVVSILIAFGLDAWWDRAVERRDLLDDLINVEQELATNIVTVGAAIEFQSRAIALIDTLLERARQIPIGGLVPLPDTILVSALVFTPTYDPSTGAVDALIASGRRSDLDDPELKGILTDLRMAVLDIREDELNARAAAHDRVLPLFWEVPAIGSAFGKVNDYYSEDFGRVALPSERVELPHVRGCPTAFSCEGPGCYRRSGSSMFTRIDWSERLN
jgi:hypothetical protein